MHRNFRDLWKETVNPGAIDNLFRKQEEQQLENSIAIEGMLNTYSHNPFQPSKRCFDGHFQMRKLRLVRHADKEDSGGAK